MAHAGLNKSRLAEKMQVAPSTISRWHGPGAIEPSLDSLEKIAEACGVRREWLSSGRGPMSVDDLARQKEPVAHYSVTQKQSAEQNQPVSTAFLRSLNIDSLTVLARRLAERKSMEALASVFEEMERREL